MNATIYRFPGSRREPDEGVPPDAIPVDREREAIVAPDGDRTWCCMLVDDGGGMLLIAGATKRKAVEVATYMVMRINATMRVCNAWPTA